MLLFDIGANRGDATWAGLNKGYDVVAIEPGRIYSELAKNYMYNSRVTTLKYAVSDTDYQQIEFYEAEEDGLSSINREWLTKEGMPYNGKPFKTRQATTITIDTLVEKYGIPDLIKIDVEGAEWNVFRGMTKKYGVVTFEWTYETKDEHDLQLNYLKELGYTEYAPQFIVNHLEEPTTWFPLESKQDDALGWWVYENEDNWLLSEWEVAGLRPTADVGMLWVR